MSKALWMIASVLVAAMMHRPVAAQVNLSFDGSPGEPDGLERELREHPGSAGQSRGNGKWTFPMS